MAAFTYQQQHPHFNLDSLFMSNNCIINPIYFPSTQDSSSVQTDNVRLIGEKIEPFMSEKTKQISTTETPTTSSIVVDLEGDDQEKTQPSMEKKKRKNGSCLDSEKDGKQRSKPKKQRKVDKKEKKDDDHKQSDYVHVRARRGQANDSHSLAERVRREKINERLKMLQSLVPGCDKMNSKAHMLDEIINYVQSLQLQVEMLSMKLAHMNPLFYDFGVALDVFFQKPTLATSSSPLPLTTTHQDSMTHDTSAIPLHENSVSFSPLQQEVHQQKLNDLYQVLLQQQQQQQQQVPNNEELLCYMDYYHLHHRQQGATNLFYYE